MADAKLTAESTSTPSTYQAITAITTAELVGMDISSVNEALRSQSRNLVKLELETSKTMVESNTQISLLEADRETLSEYVDSLLLMILEIKNTPLKNATEEVIKEREEMLRQLDIYLNDLKKTLKSVDQQLVYLYDMNEDTQKRCREKVSHALQKINEVHEEMVEVIIKHLASLEISIKDEEAFKKDLIKLLKNVDFQSLYLSEAAGESAKGFTEKLKGWFK